MLSSQDRVHWTWVT